MFEIHGASVVYGVLGTLAWLGRVSWWAMVIVIAAQLGVSLLMTGWRSLVWDSHRGWHWEMEE